MFMEPKWAGFGPVGSNEKKNWVSYEQRGRFFHAFMDKKKMLM